MLARHQMAALLVIDELRFPVHLLMRLRVLRSEDLRVIIDGAGAELSIPDEDGMKPFHYLMHDKADRSKSMQGSSSASIRMPLGKRAQPIRSQDAVASLLVGAASAQDPALAQVLLQQSAEHGYARACRKLISECGADPDAPSARDPRTPRNIGLGSSDDETRAVFQEKSERGGTQAANEPSQAAARGASELRMSYRMSHHRMSTNRETLDVPLQLERL